MIHNFYAWLTDGTVLPNARCWLVSALVWGVLVYGALAWEILS